MTPLPPVHTCRRCGKPYSGRLVFQDYEEIGTEWLDFGVPDPAGFRTSYGECFFCFMTEAETSSDGCYTIKPGARPLLSEGGAA